MRRTVFAIAVSVSFFIATGPVWAHHAFEAEYDQKKPVHLVGKVTQMEWINPHSWIHVDVKKPDGTTENWSFEAGTPNTLLRRGLKKTDLPAGTKITVFGYQSRDGGTKANAANLTFADGRALFLGSGSPGQEPK